MQMSWKWRTAPLFAIVGWFVVGWGGAPLWESAVGVIGGWVLGWQLGRYFD